MIRYLLLLSLVVMSRPMRGERNFRGERNRSSGEGIVEDFLENINEFSDSDQDDYVDEDKFFALENEEMDMLSRNQHVNNEDYEELDADEHDMDMMPRSQNGVSNYDDFDSEVDVEEAHFVLLDSKDDEEEDADDSVGEYVMDMTPRSPNGISNHNYGSEVDVEEDQFVILEIEDKEYDTDEEYDRKEKLTMLRSKGPKEGKKAKKLKELDLEDDDDDSPQHWPNYLSSQAFMHTKRPTNTAEAIKLGWRKTEEPCVPSLGEPWIYGAERSIHSSVTLYFTPHVGDISGVISGMEVDIYGYIETKLIGVYFSKEKTSLQDETYHSLAIALRNSAAQDLCDISTPAKKDGLVYVAISPDLVNQQVPIKSNLSSLTSKWKEGSCIHTMGYHWFQDTEGGLNLSQKAENTVPVVPMYNSVDGTINGLFVIATDAKQNWKGTSCTIMTPTPECMGAMNFWDPIQGLSLDNRSNGTKFCSNLCGDECQFTGNGPSGRFQTMHWSFMKNPAKEKCTGSDMGPGSVYCRSGSYPLQK